MGPLEKIFSRISFGLDFFSGELQIQMRARVPSVGVGRDLGGRPEAL
jgi:hypothetical protein